MKNQQRDKIKHALLYGQGRDRQLEILALEGDELLADAIITILDEVNIRKSMKEFKNAN